MIQKQMTLPQLERARAADAILKAKEALTKIKEESVYKPLAYFECGRYTGGSFHGLFAVYQLILEDENGKRLKNPIKKPVSDGDHFFEANGKLAEAFRIRVYNYKKK